MIFNSPTYAIFLVLFFGLYWYAFAKNIKLQNLLILLGSYMFYGWWDWRFLSLLIITTLSDYISAIFIEDRPLYKKVILWWTLVLNLGLLFVFKYFNFFIESIFYVLKVEPSSDYHLLKVILPLGISFYTFQSIAYVVDVYRGQIKATRSVINYAAYISFFPQLVAGPIERAASLLPQIERPRIFSYAQSVIGCRLIIWGIFKKIMVADNAAPIVEAIFGNQDSVSASTLFVGVFLFGIQIYCDFSGYSEIARGSAKLLGIELMQNFHYPYFARDIHQFWRRWHISLSTWFKDYVFIPLGGSRLSMSRTFFNTFAVFFISGLWHGAKSKFIVWGIFHFLIYISYMGFKRILPNWKLPTPIAILFTFIFVMIGWIFFRAEDVNTAISILKNLFTQDLFFAKMSMPMGLDKIFLGVAILFLFEYLHKYEQYGLTLSMVRLSWMRWLIYFLLILIIITYGNFNEQKFIYFDF